MTRWAATLRVYEPLAAFEGPERAYWEAFVADVPGRATAAAAEGEEALRALVGRRLPEGPERASVLEVDGVTLVSPWRTNVRAREALVDFWSDLPDVVAEAFAPAAVLERAEVELDRWRAERGTTSTHVLTCTWQVPLRWFVLVDAEEREVGLGVPAGRPDGSAGAPPGRRTGRSLVYRTPMSRARRRVARALSVLRAGLDHAAVSEGVEDLGRWLEEFHPRSLVELDYGDLVHLLDDAELGQDESARDVTLALALLAEGKTDRSAAAYARVSARMKALQAVEQAN